VPDGSDPASRTPVYAARDPLTGEVYVTDRLNASISIYDADGVYQRALTPPGAVTSWLPLGVGFDAAGLLYVTDVAGDAHKVHVIARDGTLVRTLTGSDPLQFPNGVATTGTDTWVTDSNNGQLLRFDQAGTPEVAVGRGIGTGDLSLPRGIAVAGDRLYVSDILAQGVSVYTIPDGTTTTRPGFLGSFGSEGRADGQFEYPNGVAADDRGHLYVTDKDNNRVQVWGY
jgi:DNA-binding beta-propeller fold protein YncE